MLKLGLIIMSGILAAIAGASCGWAERSLFSDVVVTPAIVQTGGSASSAICARSSVDDTGSNGAVM